MPALGATPRGALVQLVRCERRRRPRADPRRAPRASPRQEALEAAARCATGNRTDACRTGGGPRRDRRGDRASTGFRAGTRPSGRHRPTCTASPAQKPPVGGSATFTRQRSHSSRARDPHQHEAGNDQRRRRQPTCGSLFTRHEDADREGAYRPDTCPDRVGGAERKRRHRQGRKADAPGSCHRHDRGRSWPRETIGLLHRIGPSNLEDAGDEKVDPSHAALRWKMPLRADALAPGSGEDAAIAPTTPSGASWPPVFRPHAGRLPNRAHVTGHVALRFGLVPNSTPRRNGANSHTCNGRASSDKNFPWKNFTSDAAARARTSGADIEGSASPEQVGFRGRQHVTIDAGHRDGRQGEAINRPTRQWGLNSQDKDRLAANYSELIEGPALSGEISRQIRWRRACASTLLMLGRYTPAADESHSSSQLFACRRLELSASYRPRVGVVGWPTLGFARRETVETGSIERDGGEQVRAA